MFPRRRRQMLGAVVAAVVLALAACSGSSGGSGGGETPKTLTVSGNYPVTSLNPYGQYSNDAGTGFVAKQIYDTLFVSDGEGGYTAHLAKSWKASDDGKVWTMKLRKAKFSDGSSFTSADVKASVDALVAGGGPLAKVFKAVTVGTPDDSTVTFTSKTPGSSILTYLPLLRIGPAGEITKPGFFDKPVGLGPYQVTSFTSNQTVELTRNPNYWGEPAKTEKIEIKTISDISARITALMNNEVQAIWGIPDDQFKQLEDNDSLQTKVQPSYAQFTMWMNAKKPALSSYKVRKAIWKAIDFAKIQKSLYPYSATMAKAPTSQANVGAGSFPNPYTYDPKAAKKLLAEAGYADGLTIKMQYDSSHPDFKALASVMKSDLAKVGVTLEVHSKEHAVWLKDLLALNFGINLQTPAPATGDPTADLARLYTCAANRTGFCSDKLDKLIEAGNRAVAPKERTAAFIKVQEFIWDHAIGMFPMDVALTYAWSNSLSGFTPDPNSGPDLSTVTIGSDG